MIKFLINNYDGYWSPRDWDKYTNDPFNKEYVIDYMSKYIYNDIIINYLTISGDYIIELYNKAEHKCYYISDSYNSFSDAIWINKKVLLRESILNNIMDNI